MVSVASALFLPTSSAAQDWATRDVCTVTDVRIDREVIAPDLLADFRRDAATIPNSIGKFWKITSPNGTVSHLWGTFHSNDPLILDLPDNVEQIVRSARVAAFEIDPIPPTRRKLQAMQDRAGMWRTMPGGLKKLKLPAAIERSVDSRLVALGFDEDTAEWITAGGLAELVLSDPCNDFAYGTYPIQDSYLQFLAAMGGADIIGLEQPDDLFKHLSHRDNFDLARTIVLLYASYLSPDVTEADRAANYALYRNGEFGVWHLWEKHDLAQRFGNVDGPAILRDVDAYLLDQRNRTFVRELMRDLPEGDVFVAVGSAHLMGKNGLVSLLRQKGYAVTRIPLDHEVASH